MAEKDKGSGVGPPQESVSPTSTPRQSPIRATPSQAEGDRETVEEDLNERSSQQSAATGDQGSTYPVATPRTPSQAEGDRKTIEEDLNKQ